VDCVDGPPNDGAPMKIGGPLILALLLSLACWYWFYIEKMKLTPPETGLVTGFWILVVWLGKWLLNRLRKPTKDTVKR